MNVSNINFSDKLIDKLDIAYLELDHSMVVQSVSTNIERYGFPEIPEGSHVSDHLDFMVGLDATTEIHLPMISNPVGEPISIRIIPDDDNVIVVINDATNISEQRQVLQQHANDNELLLNQQEKLMQQLDEASRLQSSFLSGVSHEFRTPLSAIIGYTNLLTRNFEQSDKSTGANETYLSAVRRSSSHLLSLVENLLDHGKLDSETIVVNPKATQLSELIEDVTILLEPLTTTKSIEFDVVSNVDENVIVLVDDSRLRQCLINIIGNAIKFTDVGKVSVDLHWGNDCLTVNVEDTGLGISKENLEKILLPFWQAPDTGKAGTGLGLTISKRIIDLMGGGLTIDSTLDKGTMVKFELPAPKVEKVHNDADLEALKSTKPSSILLAEDDDDIADLVVLLLKEHKVDVTRVENGALAVEMVERFDFDMILMDIHMPVMSGYEAVETIRKSDNAIPIVIMSASPLETQQAKAEEIGCNGYLVKPVDVEDIFRMAGQVIES